MVRNVRYLVMDRRCWRMCQLAIWVCPPKAQENYQELVYFFYSSSNWVALLCTSTCCGGGTAAVHGIGRGADRSAVCPAAAWYGLNISRQVDHQEETLAGRFVGTGAKKTGH